MEPSSRDIQTNWSAGHVHPCQVDDSELPPDAHALTWLCAVPAMCCVLLALPPMFVMLAVMARWRAWRGKPTR